jgi:hypothetical protein
MNNKAKDETSALLGLYRKLLFAQEIIIHMNVKAKDETSALLVVI